MKEGKKISHYTVCKTNLKNRDAIVKALYSMGFREHMIEVSDTLMTLKGYQGDDRKQKANIRIKGSGWKKENYIGIASNDLGLELEEDGTYTLHISEYDSTKFNDQWLSKFKQNYAKDVIRQVCDQYNFLIEEDERINDELYLTVHSQY